MAVVGRTSCAYMFGASALTLVILSSAAHAQTAQQAQPFPAPSAEAFAQSLDEITVSVSKLEERGIDAAAAVTRVNSEQIGQIGPQRLSDIFFSVPSVSFEERSDDPGTAIAVRGLQDFGRVAVVVDGARQNFQRTGHNANGMLYLDPSLVADVDVVRGPVANIYGSGAIGGVVSLRTKDVEDVVRAGQRWGVMAEGGIGSNAGRGNSSLFFGARVNPNVDVFFGGSYRTHNDFYNGNGSIVPNSGNESGSGIAKLTVRPADGHEVKFGFIAGDNWYQNGQPSIPNTSAYASRTANQTATLSWQYQKPDDRLFDFKINGYWNATKTEQVKTFGTPNPITGAIGDFRSFAIDTVGFDAHNTSRFDTGSWAHALTIGGDYFRDNVSVNDRSGASAYTTPNGQRSVGGAFVQVKSTYGIFETINALRYDTYSLEGGAFSSSGDRLSPKSTIAISPTPWAKVYASYSEGYRAPSVTETLAAGSHPAAGVSNPGVRFFSLYDLLPNPNLRPEVGKNKEIGVNLKFDDVFNPGDRLRAKINVFRNDVSDYIEMVSGGGPRLIMQTRCGPPGVGGCSPLGWRDIFNDYSSMQYQNMSSARIEGVELESSYDAGNWFAGVAGSWLRGYNTDTGVNLISVPGHTIATTLGARFLDNKLTASIRWAHVNSQKNLPVSMLPSGQRDLVNIYLGYQPTPDLLFHFGIDNLLNEYYIPFATGAGTDTFLAGAAPGRVFKGGMKIRFGG